MKNIGIYIHIPFCVRKCFYCDFCSYANCMNLQNEYIQALLNEIKYNRNKNDFFVNTIYIGGGTPSIIDKENIGLILKELKNSFIVNDDAEITIEVNPGTVNLEKIMYYKQIGINRISIGLQSSNDELLKKIGRIHSFQDFNEAYDIIKNKVNFQNINVDLMIGLPSQKLQDVDLSLDEVIMKKPNHISVYSLIVEDGTKIENLISQGLLELPSEEDERSMYSLVVNKLKANGYNQYEISNFSIPGFESKHNMNCWKQNEYLGFGLAAHSYYNFKRYSNIEDINVYIKNINENSFEKNIIVHEIQEKIDVMYEYMLLGLRTINGVDLEEFYKKFNISLWDIFKEKIENLKNKNLICIDDKNIKLSKKGLDLANIVWQEFVR